MYHLNNFLESQNTTFHLIHDEFYLEIKQMCHSKNNLKILKKNLKSPRQTTLYQTIKSTKCQSIMDPHSREMQNPPWTRSKSVYQHKLHNSRQGPVLNSMQKGHTSHLPAERA